jgi:hypothetical protein
LEYICSECGDEISDPGTSALMDGSGGAAYEHEGGSVLMEMPSEWHSCPVEILANVSSLFSVPTPGWFCVWGREGDYFLI